MLYGVITVHILLRLFVYWNVKLASRAQFSAASLEAATDVLVLPMEFSGMPEIVALQHRTLVRTCPPGVMLLPGSHNHRWTEMRWTGD